MNLILEKQPKPRWWYDILIRNSDNSFYCPINIKITNLNNSSADNLSSKSGLFFALTGLVYRNFPNNWGKFFKFLSKNIKENHTDYFFVVFDKASSNIFYTSLKRIKTLQPNGNNLPFQCRWSENMEIVNRSFNESKNFLIHTLFKSVQKRAQILDEFSSEFINFVKKYQKED